MAKLQAPIETELKISITDGERLGVVTIWMGVGRFITEQDLRDRLAKFVAEEMPDGFRLQTKREWFDNKFGQCFDGEDEDGEPTYISYAMPGGENWEE